MIEFRHRIVMGGPPRTGSSLLRSILNAHPNIVAPPETSILIVPVDELRRKGKQFDKRLEERLGIDHKQIRQLINSTSGSIELVDKLMCVWAHHIERPNVDAWIEKTPRNCLRYSELSREREGVRYISVIRDGRDVVTSNFPGREGYYCSVEGYVESMQAVLGFQSNDHLIVRYEELVGDVRATLEQILSFVGLPYLPEMLDDYREKAGVSRSEKVRSGEISSQWVERWRRPEHAERIREFQNNEAAMHLLVQSGYAV